METVDFTCPECGNPVQAPKAYRGREVTCLACEAQVQVPVNAAAAEKPKKKHGPVMIVLAVLGALTVLQVGLWLLGGAGKKQDLDRVVTYRVSSSRGGASLTYTNADGGTEQVELSAADMPWIKTFNVRVGYFAYLSAQKSGDSGEVEVEIQERDGEKRSARSDAPFGVATIELGVE
jgi:hypothetical protein